MDHPVLCLRGEDSDLVPRDATDEMLRRGPARAAWPMWWKSWPRATPGAQCAGSAGRGGGPSLPAKAQERELVSHTTAALCAVSGEGLQALFS